MQGHGGSGKARTLGKQGQHSPESTAWHQQLQTDCSGFSLESLFPTVPVTHPVHADAVEGTPEQQQKSGRFLSPTGEALPKAICHQDREQETAENREADSVPMELSAQEAQSMWTPL